MRIRLVVPTLALFAAACGTGTTPVNTLPDTAADAAGTEVATQADAAPEEDSSGEPDLVTAPDESGPDTGPDVPFQECEPGSGCFLDPCTDNSDCQSGWCVEHMGDAVCTTTCQEDCPPGWTCRQVTGAEADIVYLCVSDYSNLCKPCSAGENCISPSGAQDVCVDYGDEGSFCGGTCTADADCPWGFSCGEVSTVDGVSTKQCVADSGVCPCTPRAIELALWTPCEVSNEFGTCEGKRVCTEDGLSTCDAETPAEESCDGLDNDCDGEVDEPPLVGGQYVNLCDDGNACTVDTCDGEAGCSHVALDEGECGDGDACTVGDHCEGGECVGLPVVCDDDNPCTDDFCDGLGGCTVEFNTALCDDGDPCTVNDTCGEGECSGYAVECECQVDEDCAALEDGDLCNGTLYCDQAKLPFHCAVDPATVVVCPTPEGPAAICQQAQCAPDTGECSLVPDHEGYACNDGNPCSVGDTCIAGECAPGVAALCNDGDPCTDDSCDPETGCVYAANSAPCNDGNPCTTGDTCTDGLCQGTGELACDDSNPCTDDACDAGLGCTHIANEAACDDGNACTTGDTCSGGACTGGNQWLDCDDENPCTDDGCAPQSGCTHTPNEAPCNDGNICTTVDTCQLGACLGAGLLDCNDGNVCTDDSCDPVNGCQHTTNQVACNDGNPCTTGDTCTSGLCKGTGAADCDDDNPCTNDLCSPVDGCLHVPNTNPCSDGDACTTNDTCQLGECVGGAPLNCNDGNVCTTDTCDANVGCTYLANMEPCSDGNACTVLDACFNGVCEAGEALDCDDGNVCTADSCHPALACQHEPQEGACDDLNACTITDTCQAGECVGTGELACDDSNPCTDDGCAPETGCTFIANQGPCDDGDACTQDDVCFQGSCTPGDPLDCDDGNQCTEDSCDSESGCHHDNVANGSPCDQYGGLTCVNGACLPYQAGHQLFQYTGGAQTFVVPPGVSTVRVVVVGGGGGGAGSHFGGGGSGYVLYGQYAVNGQVPVTVGAGGNGGISGTNNAPGSHGAASNFGGYLSAAGGHGGNTDTSGGGNGGSGGGGAGNSGYAGKGGSGGSDGQDGQTYPGGNGGHFDNLNGITDMSATPGAGGAAGQSSHSGGGGAGGLLLDGAGPTAGNGGESWSGKGGIGYGAGGGGGGYNNGIRPIGGKGANGVVYVEW